MWKRIVCWHAAMLAAIALVSSGLAATPAAADGDVPTGLDFDWDHFQMHASGSGGWPITWCEDDNQYVSWGGGGGFGGSETDGFVSLGFGRVSGPYDGMQTQNLWGGKDPVAPATFTGKVISMLCLNGKLYAWHTPGSEAENWEYNELISSDDKGVTWQEHPFPQSHVDGCQGCPGLAYMINYGQNYTANTDGYVYTYWVRIHNPALWNVQFPGVLWLMRAPAANEAFTDAANWEWFTGFDGNQNPQWGAMADRAPVLEDADGFMGGSAIYDPPLNMFLMATNHTQLNKGDVAWWSAPAPWGPWSLISKEFDWPSPAPLPRYTLGHFSPKWFREDGRRGVFIWFGPDRWNSAPFNLMPEPSGPALWLASALALAVCSRSKRARRS